MARTYGEGVDLVLNSLAGVAMTKSFDVLKPFGRFIEIGKRDQYEGTHVSLAPFLKGLTYATAHLDVLMLEQPKTARLIMEEVWREFAEGKIKPLPTTKFPIRDLIPALRYMSEGASVK